MIAHYQKHILQFKRPSGTSRGVLYDKETYILQIQKEGNNGVGECGLFRGLSYDDVADYEEKLQWLCHHIHEDEKLIQEELRHYPSIFFGYEQAKLNLDFGSDTYFPSDFPSGKKGIRINGLIWMGTADSMKSQIQEKLNDGFSCIKLKIGVDWPSELEIINQLRKEFNKDRLEIRVDANGAFTFEKAKQVLEDLYRLEVHSIEQPIKAGNWKEMAALCANTPTPIALDEELIGIVHLQDKKTLLQEIQPQYIILKPTLVGGYLGSDEWINAAEKQKIGWWITSALESNVGLNAIAQYTFTKNNHMPQGLGTGGLFINNFPTHLKIIKDELWKVQ